MTSTPSFFPVGSKVILQNLVKGAQYNGEQGKVTGPLRQSSQRQNVFVASINKTMAIKPVNMVYVPRDLSSLERDEMINLIKSEAETKVVVEMEALIIEGEASNGMFDVYIHVIYSFVNMHYDIMLCLQPFNPYSIFIAYLANLRKMVGESISICPNKLASLLATLSVIEKDESLAAKLNDALKNGESFSKAEMSPQDYLKKKYRKTSKKDMKEESQIGCKTCGKTNVNLSKCSGCLSVFYCCKACQKNDYGRHKVECKALKKQRENAVFNDIDVAMSESRPTIPYIGIVLPKSITGCPGEVLCNLPVWDLESCTKRAKGSNLDANKIIKAVKYFFKTYQSSVEAAKSLSVDDIGGLCVDAAFLFGINYPGVRRVFASEVNSKEGDGNFYTSFSNLSAPPDDWEISESEKKEIPPHVLAMFEQGIKQVRSDKRYVKLFG